MLRHDWLILSPGLVAASVSVVAAAVTPSRTCEAAKLKAQGKFTHCRLAADAAYAKKPSPTTRDETYAKCAGALADAYTKAEEKAAKAGASCPTTGDSAPIEELLETCTLEAREATAGNPCSGVDCPPVDCPNAGTTSVSGTFYAPNGTLPIPNALVYVPNGAVGALPEGVTCDRCGSPLGATPLVQTITDATGHFVLTGVPATTDVPLVVQIGKWRRQTVLPTVPACVDTVVDPDRIRLPRTHHEGDIPSIALSTGGADSLECLLRKIGIADSEFGIIGGTGRVHLYAGTQGTDQFDPSLVAGAQFASSTELWGNLDRLKAYDEVLLSCEGSQNPGTKSAQARQALKDYADLGGRVYLGHWHNYWLESGPAPWPSILTFAGLADLGVITADVDTALDDGQFAEWLLATQASTLYGQITLIDARHTATAVNPSLGRRWIHKDTTANGYPSVQLASFTTPIEEPATDRCGRVIFSDMHASPVDSSSPSLTFPSGGCVSNVAALSPREKVLA